jgi:hypothetical protein
MDSDHSNNVVDLDKVRRQRGNISPSMARRSARARRRMAKALVDALTTPAPREPRGRVLKPWEEALINEPPPEPKVAPARVPHCKIRAFCRKTPKCKSCVVARRGWRG